MAIFKKKKNNNIDNNPGRNIKVPKIIFNDSGLEKDLTYWLSVETSSYNSPFIKPDVYQGFGEILLAMGFDKDATVTFYNYDQSKFCFNYSCQSHHV